MFEQIDGETAVKQLSSRVSAEKILRILSNVPEFSILVEGLDTITLGDVYKTAFPNGILNSISENYLRAPTIANNKAVITKPYTTEGVEAIKSTEIVAGNEVEDTGAASETGIQYDEVNEDNEEDSQFSKEDLKEEPITDDYVYDQPVEDRFFEDREYATRQNDEMNHDDTRGSKNMNYTLSESVIEAGHKEKTKYGASFRNWITKFLAG